MYYFGLRFLPWEDLSGANSPLIPPMAQTPSDSNNSTTSNNSNDSDSNNSTTSHNSNDSTNNSRTSAWRWP